MEGFHVFQSFQPWRWNARYRNSPKPPSILGGKRNESEPQYSSGSQLGVFRRTDTAHALVLLPLMTIAGSESREMLFQEKLNYNNVSKLSLNDWKI